MAVLALAAAAAAQETAPRVLAVELENDINPVTQDYVIDAIERGEREEYDAVVIQLDTPGGLDSSMRAIIKKELDADVPVVVYVSPAGLAGRLGRRVHHARGRRRRDGAGDQHRLLDAGRGRRR